MELQHDRADMARLKRDGELIRQCRQPRSRKTPQNYTHFAKKTSMNEKNKIKYPHRHLLHPGKPPLKPPHSPKSPKIPPRNIRDREFSPPQLLVKCQNPQRSVKLLFHLPGLEPVSGE